MTIKDLSAMTGYSVGTISRVLNNQPNVSERARIAILDAVRRSGFQLNVNAKQLKQQHATSILVVVKGIGNELFGNLIERLQTLVAQTPHPLVVDYLDEEQNEVRRAVQLCREKKPLGVLFLGGNRQNFLTDFKDMDLPCVLVTNDASTLDFPNLSSVTSDDFQAGRVAIEHLLSLGHRRIAVIGGHRAMSDIARLRYEGCLAAFREHDVPFDPERDYVSVRFSCADGYRGAEELLRRHPGITAIFAMSDVMAIGGIRALWDHGLRVPEDVSVMGFDGLDIGEYLVPKLATIRQSVPELAQRSIGILKAQIENRGESIHETIPVAVSSRESTRAI